MIDTKTILVSALTSLGYPVVYEYSIEDTVPSPCITFIESSNSSLMKGDGLEYSDILYTIKVWEKDLAIQTPIVLQMDDLLSSLGFTREFSMDFKDCKVLRYRAVGYRLK